MPDPVPEERVPHAKAPEASPKHTDSPEKGPDSPARGQDTTAKKPVDKKLVLLVGAFVLIFVIGGAYFFLNSSASRNSGQNYPQNPSSQNTETDYTSAMRVSEQRNEFLLSEGENRTLSGQTIVLAKVGLSSAIIKIGNETKVLGSGKDYYFGDIGIRILSTTYSNEKQYRKAIIRLTKLGNISVGNLSSNQGKEFTLAEGESATEGSLEITINSISREAISVTLGGENKAILVGDWHDSEGYRVRIKDIFYTGEPAESRAVILIGRLGN